MKTSACIVTYNAVSTQAKRDELTKSISSLLKNTGSDFTLYVVDNASDDGTADFVSEKFPEVCLIRNSENLGFGRAHNVVIDMLESDYHFIVNPDIEVRGDVIGTLSQFMQEHDSVGAVNPVVKNPDGTDQLLAKVQPRLRYLAANHLSRSRESNSLVREYCKADADYTKPVQVENLSGCFFAVRTSLFKTLGGFDDDYFMYFEDYDLARRIMESHDLFVVPAVVYHAWERDSKKSAKLLKVHIKSMFTYMRKWRMGI